MPTIITADDLRGVLGVSEALYSDEYLNQVIDTSEGVFLPMLKTLDDGEDWTDGQIAKIQSAIYAISVEVFQSRIAPGGQIEGVDFTASPFRLGRSLFNKVSGLCADIIDVETMVQ